MANGQGVVVGNKGDRVVGRLGSAAQRDVVAAHVLSGLPANCASDVGQRVADGDAAQAAAAHRNGQRRVGVAVGLVGRRGCQGDGTLPNGQGVVVGNKGDRVVGRLGSAAQRDVVAAHVLSGLPANCASDVGQRVADGDAAQAAAAHRNGQRRVGVAVGLVGRRGCQGDRPLIDRQRAIRERNAVVRACGQRAFADGVIANAFTGIACKAAGKTVVPHQAARQMSVGQQRVSIAVDLALVISTHAQRDRGWINRHRAIDVADQVALLVGIQAAQAGCVRAHIGRDTVVDRAEQVAVRRGRVGHAVAGDAVVGLGAAGRRDRQRGQEAAQQRIGVAFVDDPGAGVGEAPLPGASAGGGVARLGFHLRGGQAGDAGLATAANAHRLPRRGGVPEVAGQCDLVHKASEPAYEAHVSQESAHRAGGVAAADIAAAVVIHPSNQATYRAVFGRDAASRIAVGNGAAVI